MLTDLQIAQDFLAANPGQSRVITTTLSLDLAGQITNRGQSAPTTKEQQMKQQTPTRHLVQEFHEAFGHPVSAFPNRGDRATRELRVKLIAEELGELAAALGVRLTLTVEPTAPPEEQITVLRTEALGEELVNLTETADALADLDYVVQGAVLVFGIPPEVVEEVHRSNMSKLGADGKPLYRPDGKIMKGPNYTPPDILPIIAAKLEDAVRLG